MGVFFPRTIQCFYECKRKPYHKIYMFWKRQVDLVLGTVVTACNMSQIWCLIILYYSYCACSFSQYISVCVGWYIICKNMQGMTNIKFAYAQQAKGVYSYRVCMLDAILTVCVCWLLNIIKSKFNQTQLVIFGIALLSYSYRFPFLVGLSIKRCPFNRPPHAGNDKRYLSDKIRAVYFV